MAVTTILRVHVTDETRCDFTACNRDHMIIEGDRHGNIRAEEGVDRCSCGCKYWEHDRCIDCGTQFAA